MSIHFLNQDQGLTISFETERLKLTSYQEKDFPHSVTLYGDERITGYFDHGKPRSKQEVKELVGDIGFTFFKEQKPYGLFTAYEKDSNRFVGHFDLLPGKEPGELEFGYIISKDQQRKGFGTEIASAIINQLATAIIKRGDQINRSRLSTLVATVHPENIGSKRILEKIGMTFIKKIEKEGWAPRLYYSMDMEP